MTNPLIGKRIETDEETWEILGVGVERDGLTFFHLKHPTRVRWQANGDNPVQTTRWLDASTAF